MRRIKRTSDHRKLQKGGGKDGAAGGSRSSPSGRQPLKRTNTNTADKSTWQLPPKKDVVFFQGQRVRGRVRSDGRVDWTVDGSVDASSGPIKIPARELKDMRRAWNEYIKSPNSKKMLYANLSNDDGREQARLRIYKGLGFKVTNPVPDVNSVYLDNR